MGVEDAIPLPAADQLVRESSGGAADRPAVPERQQISEVAVKLVLQAVGPDSPAELRIVRVPERRRVIIGGGTENGGTDVHYLPPRVIGFETQSVPGTLGQRDIRGMVAGRSHIHPRIGGADIGVRTRSHGDVLGPLRDRDTEPGRADSAAEASRGVLTHLRSNRIVIHRGREVIGLVADIADLHREV